MTTEVVLYNHRITQRPQGKAKENDMEQLFAKALDAENTLDFIKKVLSKAESDYLENPTEETKEFYTIARENYIRAVEYNRGMREAIVALGQYEAYREYKR